MRLESRRTTRHLRARQELALGPPTSRDLQGGIWHVGSGWGNVEVLQTQKLRELESTTFTRCRKVGGRGMGIAGRVKQKAMLVRASTCRTLRPPPNPAQEQRGSAMIFGCPCRCLIALLVLSLVGGGSCHEGSDVELLAAIKRPRARTLCGSTLFGLLLRRNDDGPYIALHIVLSNKHICTYIICGNKTFSVIHLFCFASPVQGRYT